MQTVQPNIDFVEDLLARNFFSWLLKTYPIGALATETVDSMMIKFKNFQDAAGFQEIAEESDYETDCDETDIDD